MIDYKEQTATTIINNPREYSVVEIINAIRYFGRIKNIEQLSRVLIIDMNVFLLQLTEREKWSLSILEAIKQFEYFDDIEPLGVVIQSPAQYDNEHLIEVIKIAGNHEHHRFLQLIAQNTIDIDEEIRKLANEELFKRRSKGIITMPYEILPEANSSAKRNNNENMLRDLKQVFISYKKKEQRFANEVVSYLTEFHHTEFEILYDEFEVFAGDSLPDVLNSMLDRSETSLMVWTPEYFSERGWAQVEKDGLLSKRVREGKRFVPLFLRGESNIIPTLFSQYVFVDFREYEKNKDPVIFRKKMDEVVRGLNRARDSRARA